MIKVLVNGACGKMGREVVKTVINNSDMELVGVVDHNHTSQDVGQIIGIGNVGVSIQADLGVAIEQSRPDVMVDFTTPDTVMGHLRTALSSRVRCVVGTTGFSETDLKELEGLCLNNQVGCLVAPNFAIGAILMMKFAVQAAKYMPHIEIIELHHDNKLDAPSGTAMKTAQAIANVRDAFRQGHFSEEEKITGARGGEYEGMRIHSVRLPGFVAHQEVICGGLGQVLTIRHDSISRESFMPGVSLGIREIMRTNVLVYGLDQFIND